MRSMVFIFFASACTPSTPAPTADVAGRDAGPEVRPDVFVTPPADAGPPFSSQTDGEVTTTSVVAVGGDFLYFDLESAAQVEVTTPENDTSWDLAFSRVHIKSNGGTSGIGGVEIAVLEGQDFAALAEAPAEGYLVDLDDTDFDNVPDYVMSAEFGHGTGWWDYNEETHVITVHDYVYVIHSVEGNYFKLQMLDYYDPVTGDSGYPRFHWAQLAPPGGFVDAGPDAADAAVNAADAGRLDAANGTDAG